MNTFSRLDFQDRITEDLIKKMFVYLNKTFTPVKKEYKFLPVMRRQGMCDVSTIIRHFDRNKVINHLHSQIRNCSTRQRMHIPRWRKYIDIIKETETHN